MVLFLAGCSLESPLEKKDSGKSDKKKSDVVIGVSISTLNNPFFVKIKDGIEAEAKKQELKLNLQTLRTMQRNKQMTLMI